MKKQVATALLPSLVLAGCGHPTFTPVAVNPEFIVVTKYDQAHATTKLVHDSSTMNAIVTEVNAGSLNIMPNTDRPTSCPAAINGANYDIVVHYNKNNSSRTFVLMFQGCTFLEDEKDGITMYADVPDARNLFQ